MSHISGLLPCEKSASVHVFSAVCSCGIIRFETFEAERYIMFIKIINVSTDIGSLVVTEASCLQNIVLYLVFSQNLTLAGFFLV